MYVLSHFCLCFATEALINGTWSKSFYFILSSFELVYQDLSSTLTYRNYTLSLLLTLLVRHLRNLGKIYPKYLENLVNIRSVFDSWPSISDTAPSVRWIMKIYLKTEMLQIITGIMK